MPSAQDRDRHTISIEDDGRVLASASVEPTDRPGVVHTDLHVESGQLPPATRTRIVDAVLEHPDVHDAERLLATMPLGDTEMLDRVRERSHVVETRATGATVIVESELDGAGRKDEGRDRP
jgi:hypothetical protein